MIKGKTECFFQFSKTALIVFLLVLFYPEKQYGIENETLNANLFEAIASQNSMQVSESLKKGADPNTKRDGISAITASAAVNSVNICKVLFEGGAKTASLENEAKSALYYTVKNRNFEFTEFLLKKGADPNVRVLADNYEYGATPLYLAVADKNIEIVKLLIKYKADPDIVSRSRVSPLMQAAFNGDADAVQLLLKHGADMNYQGVQGNTPLHYAALSGNSSVMDLLLKQGSSINLKNDSGITPRSILQEYIDLLPAEDKQRIKYETFLQEYR